MPNPSAPTVHTPIPDPQAPEQSCHEHFRTYFHFFVSINVRKNLSSDGGDKLGRGACELSNTIWKRIWGIEEWPTTLNSSSQSPARITASTNRFCLRARLCPLSALAEYLSIDSNIYRVGIYIDTLLIRTRRRSQVKSNSLEFRVQLNEFSSLIPWWTNELSSSTNGQEFTFEPKRFWNEGRKDTPNVRIDINRALRTLLSSTNGDLSTVTESTTGKTDYLCFYISLYPFSFHSQVLYLIYPFWERFYASLLRAASKITTRAGRDATKNRAVHVKSAVRK